MVVWWCFGGVVFGLTSTESWIRGAEGFAVL